LTKNIDKGVIFFCLLLAFWFHPGTFLFIVLNIIAYKAICYLTPENLPIKKQTWLQAQDERETKGKMLRNLQNPCPYCKFNLKFGKDRCDECGKIFAARS
jgi:hypothetical protein